MYSQKLHLPPIEEKNKVKNSSKNQIEKLRAESLSQDSFSIPKKTFTKTAVSDLVSSHCNNDVHYEQESWTSDHAILVIKNYFKNKNVNQKIEGENKSHCDSFNSVARYPFVFVETEEKIKTSRLILEDVHKQQFTHNQENRYPFVINRSSYYVKNLKNRLIKQDFLALFTTCSHQLFEIQQIVSEILTINQHQKNYLQWLNKKRLCYHSSNHFQFEISMFLNHFKNLLVFVSECQQPQWKELITQRSFQKIPKYCIKELKWIKTNIVHNIYHATNLLRNSIHLFIQIMSFSQNITQKDHWNDIRICIEIYHSILSNIDKYFKTDFLISHQYSRELKEKLVPFHIIDILSSLAKSRSIEVVDYLWSTLVLPFYSSDFVYNHHHDLIPILSDSPLCPVCNMSFNYLNNSSPQRVDSTSSNLNYTHQMAQFFEMEKNDINYFISNIVGPEDLILYADTFTYVKEEFSYFDHDLKLANNYKDYKKSSFTNQYLQLLIEYSCHLWRTKLILPAMKIKNNECCSVLLWSKSEVWALVKRCHNSSKIIDSSILKKMLTEITLYLKDLASWTTWDIAFTELLRENAETRHSLVASENFGTRIGDLIHRILAFALGVFMSYHQKRNEEYNEIKILAILEKTSTFTLSWLEYYIWKSVLLWNVKDYLSITQIDIKNFLDVLRHFHLPNLDTENNSSISLLSELHLYVLSTKWADINLLINSIQILGSSSTKKFYDGCHNAAFDCFVLNMPHGKIWQKKYHIHGSAHVHNKYVDEMIRQILNPIFDVANNLSIPNQISVLSISIKAFCEAWMDFICLKKIKFSIYGAQQLRLDFFHVINWLKDVPNLSAEAVQSIMSLEILRRLHGTSLILMKQPESQCFFRKSRVSPCNVSMDFNIDSRSLADNRNGCCNEEFGSLGSLMDEDFVPNKEKWMALRVQQHLERSRWNSCNCFSQICK